MVSKTDRKFETRRRHIRVRRKISGTAERPRLCIYRSNKNLFAQSFQSRDDGTVLRDLSFQKRADTLQGSLHRQRQKRRDRGYDSVFEIIFQR